MQEQQQGKGKCKLIIAESSDDEEELAAAALDIIEDSATNKVPVETKFKRFVEAGAPKGRPKKAKTTTTPENVVDLVSTPPPPSPTQIIEEQAPTQKLVIPLELYKSVMPEMVKSKFDKDTNLQAFFETLPALF